MDSIPPSSSHGQLPAPDSGSSDAPHRSLRKRTLKEAQATPPEGSPLTKRKVTRTALTFHSPVPRNGRMYVDYRCLRFPKSHRLDMEPLIATNYAIEHTPEVFTDTSGVAGTGVFADKDYGKYEIVGFYRGQLMKHFPVPPDIIEHYCQQESIDPGKLPELILATWIDHPNKPAEFITLSDSHTLWSGITVYGDEDENIELGINGLSGGNVLAYLNHIRPGNVHPIPTLRQNARIISSKQRLHARKGAYDENDVWIPIVTTREVKAGEELGFDYDKESGDILFSLVGYDIFKKPEQYFQVKDDHVWQITEQPSPEPASDTDSGDQESLDSSIPDFRSTLSEDEEVLVERWLNRDPKTHKVLHERIRAQDERAVQLLIFLAGHEQGLRVADVSAHLNWMGFRFASDRPMASQAYRDYVCCHFQKQEAARILQIASIDPEELMQMGGIRTIAETCTLLANVSEDTEKARKHLDAYLKRTFYAVRRKFTENSAIYDGIKLVLQARPKVLGLPACSFNTGYIYRYMVERELFEKEDVVRHMPFTHLKDCFTSEDLEDIDRGIADLNRFTAQWIKDNKDLRRLAPLLNRLGIPNIFDGDKRWNSAFLEQLPSVKSLFTEQVETDVSAMVMRWLAGDSKGSLDIRQYLKTHTDKAMGEIGKILKRDYGKSLADIVKIHLAPMKIEGLEVSIPALRNAIYSQSAGESIPVLGDLLEGVVHAFYRKAKTFHETHDSYQSADGEKLDDMFSKDDWDLLKEEFQSKCTTSNYPAVWTSLLKECPSPSLHKLYMSMVLQIRTPGQVRDQLSKKKIPRFPDKDHQWTIPLLMRNLYDNEIFDVKYLNDGHIAVLIATEVDMTDKTVNGKDFNDFLKEELQRRKYNSSTLGNLRRMKYPAALNIKRTFSGQHSSTLSHSRKKK